MQFTFWTRASPANAEIRIVLDFAISPDMIFTVNLFLEEKKVSSKVGVE